LFGGSKDPRRPRMTYEIKLDGFRVEALKRHGKVTLLLAA
jgi:ATP-dependent DNA ligase